MSELKQETKPATTTATIQLTTEEKQVKVIAKVKELFEKENFRKNNLLTSNILNQATNSVFTGVVLKDSLLVELNIDQKQLDEILKKEELKSVIIYNPQENTVAPTWKRLRNILYLTNIDKETKTELIALIEADIKTVTTDYKIEAQHQTESIKITVTKANEEEALTKVLFTKLFMKQYIINEKNIHLQCVIEEELIATPSNNIPQYPPHYTFNKSNGNMNQFQQQAFQQNYFQQIQLLMLQQQNEMNKNQQFRGGKGNRNFKGQNQGGQFANRNGYNNHYAQNNNNNNNNNNLTNNNAHPNNNNLKANNNNLHQPSNHRQNKGNKTAGKFNNKFPRNNQSKASQRTFNANDNDFPVLQ